MASTLIETSSCKIDSDGVVSMSAKYTKCGMSYTVVTASDSSESACSWSGKMSLTEFVLTDSVDVVYEVTV